MITLQPSEINNSHRPFIASRGNADGTVTLYYQGDPLPPAPPEPPPSIPPITSRQLRMALTASGLRATVEAAVASGSQDLRDWWEYEPIMDRYHPLVVGMISALGKTPAEADAVWALGATL
jgi:hypothetical protein